MKFIKKIKSALIFVCSALFCLCTGLALCFAPVRVNADSITSFVMRDGASVRCATPTGIRFCATIDANEYETLTAKNATFCMVVMPYDYVDRYEAGIDEDSLFNRDFYWWEGKSESMAGSQVEVIHYETDSLGEVREDGKYWFQCALTNLKASNYSREFIARAYVKVVQNGTPTYIFTPENETNIRSVEYVSQRALAVGASAYGDTQLAVLKRFATQFIQNDGTVELEGDFGTVTSVFVDDVAVEGATGATFAYNKTGRHTAKITNSEGITFAVPFVVADVIIRQPSDWVWTNNTTDKYFVVANDIDFAGTKIVEAKDDLTGTFDGYGHTIRNASASHTPFTTKWMYMTVMDLSIVDLSFTDNTNNYIFGTTMAGTVRNCFISTKTKYAATTDGTNTAALISIAIHGYVENTIVVDTSKVGLNGLAVDPIKNMSTLGALREGEAAEKLTNVLCVTNGVPVLFKADGTNYSDYTSSCAGVTKLAGNSVAVLTGENLTAFIEKAKTSENNDWALNEDTNELYLMGSVVYKVVKMETLDPQFVKVNESGTVSLKFSEVAKTVEVEGVAVSFTQTDAGITFNYTATGRRSARITTTSGDVYDIPFVLATYVVDSAAALRDMHNHMTDGTSGSKDEYIVLATNIDWKNENGTGSYNFTPTKTIASWSGIFDGYGHTISNITIYKAYGLICTTFYGKTMDLVIRNAGSSNSGNGGVLCGSLGHASNKNETTYKNTVENVVIIGKNSNAANAGLIARQINAKAIVNNCIVVDTGNMNGTQESKNRSAIGGVPNGKTATITNTIAGTTGVAVINATTFEDITSSYGVTKVDSEKAITAAHLSAFATAAGVNSSWTYNSTTGELSLMGNVVFKVSVS